MRLAFTILSMGLLRMPDANIARLDYDMIPPLVIVTSNCAKMEYIHELVSEIFADYATQATYPADSYQPE